MAKTVETMSMASWKSLFGVIPIFLLSAYAVYQVGAPPKAAKAFATPKEAADALVAAASADDLSALTEIFGTDGKDLISTSDPVADKESVSRFAAEARAAMSLDTSQENRAVILVGENQWPFPVPIVKLRGNWYFDAKQGRDEIVYRRIGENELDVIAICRGYVEAQREYAATTHDDSEINQYAQRLISTPGKQDGLYWQNPDGTPGGPISEIAAKAIAQGYAPGKSPAYHGYYFKILKGQGPAAPLGKIDYMIEGVMIGGFALAATPADYGVTGIKTFMVSNDGIVYQKDLGPNSGEIFKKMELYNPDQSWERLDRVETSEQAKH